MSDSRGNAISAYSPAFSKGAQVYEANIASGSISSEKLKAYATTGTIISAGIVYAVAHGLGAVPSFVQVSNLGTMAHISAGVSVGEVSSSARTSANVYVAGKTHGTKFSILVLA